MNECEEMFSNMEKSSKKEMNDVSSEDDLVNQSENKYDFLIEAQLDASQVSKNEEESTDFDKFLKSQLEINTRSGNTAKATN